MCFVFHIFIPCSKSGYSYISSCLQGSHMLCVDRQWVNFIQGGSMQVSIQAVLSRGVCDDGWLCSETACNFKIFEAEMAELCTIP